MMDEAAAPRGAQICIYGRDCPTYVCTCAMHACAACTHMRECARVCVCIHVRVLTPDCVPVSTMSPSRDVCAPMHTCTCAHPRLRAGQYHEHE